MVVVVVVVVCVCVCGGGGGTHADTTTTPPPTHSLSAGPPARLTMGTVPTYSASHVDSHSAACAPPHGAITKRKRVYRL
jgi:hypothetical protein